MSFGSAHDGLRALRTNHQSPQSTLWLNNEEDPAAKDPRGGVWPEVRPEHDKMLALMATKLALFFNFPFLMHQKCHFYCEHFRNNGLSHQWQ